MEKPKSRKRRPRKRRFHGNQFSKSETSEIGESSRSRTNELVDSRSSSDRSSVIEEREAMSASFVKLGSSSVESGVGGSRDTKESSNRSKGLRLFRYEDLETFFNMFPCPSCFCSPEVEGKNFTVNEQLNGIASEMTIFLQQL